MVASAPMKLAASDKVRTLEHASKEPLPVVGLILTERQREHDGKQQEAGVPGIAPKLPEGSVTIDCLCEPSMQGLVVKSKRLP
jgi:hypothetical protein